MNCGWFWCLRYLILHMLTVFTVFTGKPQIISIDLLTSWGFPPALLVFVVHSPALSYSTIKHSFISVLLFMICCPISFMIREGNGGVSIHATELPVFKSRSSLIFDFIGGRMNTEYNSYVCQGFIWTSVKKKKVGGGEGGSYDITSQYRENVTNVSNISRRRLICDLLFLYAAYEVKHGEVVFTTICIYTSLCWPLYTNNV